MEGENLQYIRVKLVPSSNEFKEVERLFRETMTDDKIITTVELVENPFLREKYCRKKDRMGALAIQNNPQRMANEMQLFHGTSPDVVDAICKHNFDWRVCGKSGTMYGEGSYFAVKASYSHSYARKGADSSHFMFLARVLGGSYTKGKSEYRRPPLKDPTNPASDLYDSCVDDEYNPKIFVVFDSDQFYPEFIINYLTMETDNPNDFQQPMLINPQTHITNPFGFNAYKTLSHSGPNLHQPLTAPGSSQSHIANPSGFSTSPCAYKTLSRAVSNLHQPLTAPGGSQSHIANPWGLSTSPYAYKTLSLSDSNLQQPITVPGSTSPCANRALSHSVSNLQQQSTAVGDSQSDDKTDSWVFVTSPCANRALSDSALNPQQQSKASKIRNRVKNLFRSSKGNYV